MVEKDEQCICFFAETRRYKVSLFWGVKMGLYKVSLIFWGRKWVAIRSNNFQIYPEMDGYKV